MTKAEKDALKAEKAAQKAAEKAAKEADKAGEAPVEPAVTSEPTGTSAESLAPKAPEEVKKNLFYRGQAVTGVSNKIVNGKLYKEISTNTTTELLTPEDFVSQVTTK
jgi:hypothetical protein